MQYFNGVIQEFSTCYMFPFKISYCGRVKRSRAVLRCHCYGIYYSLQNVYSRIRSLDDIFFIINLTQTQHESFYKKLFFIIFFTLNTYCIYCTVQYTLYYLYNIFCAFFFNFLIFNFFLFFYKIFYKNKIKNKKKLIK